MSNTDAPQRAENLRKDVKSSATNAFAPHAQALRKRPPFAKQKTASWLAICHVWERERRPFANTLASNVLQRRLSP